MFRLLLDTGSDSVVNDVMLVLSNIAGDSVKLRDKLLQEGILFKVLEVMSTVEKNSLLEKTCSWFLSNLCRHQASEISAVELKPCLYTLALYFRCPKLDVLKNVWWALKYLTDGSSQFIDSLLDLGICKPLVDLLS
jgi:importin subunit alpha-6/7